MAYTYPAVKGVQNGVDYFQTTLTYGDINTLVQLPEDYLGDELLDPEQTMQREVNWRRVKAEMTPYLLNADAFFSALTLFIVPIGEPVPLEEDEGYQFKAVEGGKVGTLEIHSSCVLFPGDGQHRTAAIKELLKDRRAIRENPGILSNEVPVVLIPFHDRQQVRQLFSDLNLTARQPNKTIGYSFETRRPEAIIAKRVEREVSLFKGRVNRFSNTLSNTAPQVITLNALVASTQELLAGLGYGEEALKPLASKPETDPAIGEVAQAVAEVWEGTLTVFPQWKEVEDNHRRPGELREMFIFPHGLGWLAIGHAAKVLLREDPEEGLERLIETLENIDWCRSAPDGTPNPKWQGVAMMGKRVNNTSSSVKATAGYILERAGASGEAARPYLAALANARINSEPMTVR